MQRLFWRDEEGILSEYCMTRVMFGMASAPFCAVRAMIQCAIDYEREYPEAARVVK